VRKRRSWPAPTSRSTAASTCSDLQWRSGGRNDRRIR
jgi:hypothetical protein